MSTEGSTREKIQDPLVVVSDIHLKAPEDERSQILYQLIEHIDAEKVEYFVLLGDIFDFCLGSHAYFQKRFQELGKRLTGLAKKGVEVLFFEGNHEFGLPSLGWRGVQFIDQKERIVELSNGKRIALSHGDLLAPDKSYLAFRAVVKSKLVLKLSSKLIPGALLNAYAQTHANVSRMRHDEMEKCHEEVQEGIREWMQGTDADAYIFGHYHIPYAEPLQGERLMASLESWDKPNFLTLDSRGNILRGFPELGQPTKRLILAQSILPDSLY